MTTAIETLDKTRAKIDEAERAGGGLVTQKEVLQRVELSKRRAQRTARVTIAVVALIAVAALTVAALAFPRIARVEADTSLNRTSLEALQLARTEARAAGVPEDQLPTLPDTADQLNGADIVTASSELVLARLKNDPAYRGQAGIPGPSCPPSNSACVGSQGLAGAAGENGQAGEPGANSTVPGPAGPGGAAGANGADGSNGLNGTDGQNGINGNDGQPGSPGMNGPMPISQEFVGGLDDCAFATTYQNPDGSTFVLSAPTPGTNCFGG